MVKRGQRTHWRTALTLMRCHLKLRYGHSMEYYDAALCLAFSSNAGLIRRSPRVAAMTRDSGWVMGLAYRLGAASSAPISWPLWRRHNDETRHPIKGRLMEKTFDWFATRGVTCINRFRTRICRGRGHRRRGWCCCQLAKCRAGLTRTHQRCHWF
jgi:hypothetical protein